MISCIQENGLKLFLTFKNTVFLGFSLEILEKWFLNDPVDENISENVKEISLNKSIYLKFRSTEEEKKQYEYKLSSNNKYLLNFGSFKRNFWAKKQHHHLNNRALNNAGKKTTLEILA